MSEGPNNYNSCGGAMGEASCGTCANREANLTRYPLYIPVKKPKLITTYFCPELGESPSPMGLYDKHAPRENSSPKNL